MGKSAENVFDEIESDDLLNEEFLNEFELEMAKLEKDGAAEVLEEEFLHALERSEDFDSILEGARERMDGAFEEVGDADEMPSETEMTEELSGEAAEAALPEQTELEGLLAESAESLSEEGVSLDAFSLESLVMEEPEKSAAAQSVPAALPGDDEDVLKILADLGDIGLEEEMRQEMGPDYGMPADEIGDETLLHLFETDTVSPDENSEPEEKAIQEKVKTSGKKEGFFVRLGRILFGEDEEEEIQEKSAKAEAFAPDNAAFLSVFGESEKPAELEGDGKKKKEKKEKKKKPKKERTPKPKKEKKPKAPKEPDRTPPLPKKPVILIFLLVASIVVLILTGTNLFGYSAQLKNAKNAYAKKNYSEAFSCVSGLEIKEKDKEIYNKYHIMALVGAEYEAYESLADAELYDLALDCLVRTIGRFEKYKADAERYGCLNELNALVAEAENRLNETFGVSRERALEIYAYRNREVYSEALRDIIKELELIKVKE